MALEKGTEEWMFWSDLFQLCKKYWDVKADDEYFVKLVSEAYKLYNKYKTTFALRMIFSFIDTQEEKLKELKSK